MKLTQFQKEILDKIISKEVYDIYSFFEVFLKIQPIPYNWNRLRGFVDINIQRDTKYSINYDKVFGFEKEKIEDISNKIASFTIIYDFLLKEKLIVSINILTRNYVPAFFDVDIQKNTINFEPILHRINKLILDCFFVEFIISPELEEFKNRNYSTLSEFDITEQNKDRKKSLRWTIVTAFTAIMLSLSSIILQIAFSGKERDVKIVNANAFPDSIKILLLKNYNINDNFYDVVRNKDTIKSK